MRSKAPSASTLVMIAGPNGAGKSTFFEVHLRQTGLRFVNADLIARSIAPDDPSGASYAAAQAAERERQLLVSEHESFCFETVFSDPSGKKLQFLAETKAAGYLVHLVFIGLSSPELSEARVTQRVLAGGHDVPTEKLFSRYPRTLANLQKSLPLVSSADLYDNSDAEKPYRLIARFEVGRCVERHPPLPAWAAPLFETKARRRR